MVNIQLLGGLLVRSSEWIVTRFRYYKAGSLLGYLAYFSQAHTPPYARERLIEMLWPEAEPETGHKNLRNLLFALRPVLEPPGVPPGAVLCAERFTVRLNPDALTCDVHQFEAAARKAGQPELLAAERAEWGVQAAQLYQGPLVPGYYEAWIGPEASRRASLFVEVALLVAPALVQRGQLEQALALAQQAISADPLSETATPSGARQLARGRRLDQSRRRGCFASASRHCPAPLLEHNGPCDRGEAVVGRLAGEGTRRQYGNRRGPAASVICQVAVCAGYMRRHPGRSRRSDRSVKPEPPAIPTAGRFHRHGRRPHISGATIPGLRSGCGATLS